MILSDSELLDLAFAGALGANIKDLITEEERIRLIELLLLFLGGRLQGQVQSR